MPRRAAIAADALLLLDCMTHDRASNSKLRPGSAAAPTAVRRRLPPCRRRRTTRLAAARRNDRRGRRDRLARGRARQGRVAGAATALLVLAPGLGATRRSTEAPGSFGGLRLPLNVALAAGGDVYLLDPESAPAALRPLRLRFRPCPAAAPARARALRRLVPRGDGDRDLRRRSLRRRPAATPRPPATRSTACCCAPLSRRRAAGPGRSAHRPAVAPVGARVRRRRAALRQPTRPTAASTASTRRAAGGRPLPRPRPLRTSPSIASDRLYVLADGGERRPSLSTAGALQLARATPASLGAFPPSPCRSMPRASSTSPRSAAVSCGRTGACDLGGAPDRGGAASWLALYLTRGRLHLGPARQPHRALPVASHRARGACPRAPGRVRTLTAQVELVDGRGPGPAARGGRPARWSGVHGRAEDRALATSRRMTYDGRPAWDCLVRSPPGRYLWLRLELARRRPRDAGDRRAAWSSFRASACAATCPPCSASSRRAPTSPTASLRSSTPRCARSSGTWTAGRALRSAVRARDAPARRGGDFLTWLGSLGRHRADARLARGAAPPLPQGRGAPLPPARHAARAAAPAAPLPRVRPPRCCRASGEPARCAACRRRELRPGRAVLRARPSRRR